TEPTRSALRPIPRDKKQAVVPPTKMARAQNTQKTKVPNLAALAKARLSLSGDELLYLNPDPVLSLTRWSARFQPDEASALLARLLPTVGKGDSFVDVPLPRVAALTAGGEALVGYARERQIVDARLQRKVTLRLKATSLSQLCQKLSEETGIMLSAGRGVADDNLTIFCTGRPLREVMRQVAELLGFTWERSGEEGAYRYRLVQPLRAQLLEEELRNRDRDAALIALDAQMRERYQSLLGLSLEEVQGRKEGEKIGGLGWGPAQLYFSLSPEETAALRSGQKLRFGGSPASAPWGDADEGVSAQRSLPEGMEEKILRAQEKTTRVGFNTNGTAWIGFGPPESMSGGAAPASVPDARAVVELQIVRGADGQATLRGGSGVALQLGEFQNFQLGDTNLAAGEHKDSPLRNAEINAQHKGKVWSKTRVSIAPESARRYDKTNAVLQGRATTAELLEAIHKATGRDVIGDHYTRLYDTSSLTVRDASLFEALCKVGDAALMRWDVEKGQEEGGFLRLRTPDFYRRRPQEVPARLLSRWAGALAPALPLDELLEMARLLSDEQLDSPFVTNGAKALYGIAEWELVRSRNLRPVLRLLAALPRESVWQRGDGKDVSLTLDALDPTNQQRFWSLTFANNPPSARRPRAADLSRALVSVLYRNERPTPDTPPEFTAMFRYGGPSTGYRRHIYSRTRSWGESDTP
ncbi:hypothetical protein, partial [Armatimonas sp.]|uniref:hypothetical protein n=1 Tax=Armatimonas sp. TaxID=1872638 RepID=UPI00286D5ED1